MSFFGRIPAWGQWVALAVLGLLAGQVLARLGLPAALMLGPLGVGFLLVHAGGEIRVPKLWHQAAQGVVGCLIAAQINTSVFAEVGRIWPEILLFIVLTLSAANLTGLGVSRTTGVDREIAIWGFLPGMAGTIIAMADERGLDSRMVALIQMVRLMVVIGTMVTVAMFVVGAGAHPIQGGVPTVGSTLRVLMLAGVGILAARWIPGMPAPASLIPMVLAAALALSGLNMAMPGWLTAIGYLFIGAQIGLRMTPQLFATGLRILPKLLIASLLLIGLCAVTGVVMSLISGVDMMSAMLGTVPGSVDSILLIALNTHADVTFVMTLQTLRMFAVALAGPFLARGLIRLTSRFAPAPLPPSE